MSVDMSQIANLQGCEYLRWFALRLPLFGAAADVFRFQVISLFPESIPSIHDRLS
jgi:hypothetical protein